MKVTANLASWGGCKFLLLDEQKTVGGGGKAVSLPNPVKEKREYGKNRSSH